MLDQCWPNVVDGGPTLVQCRIDVLCLLAQCWFNVLKAACLESREITGSSPALAFKLQRNKTFLPRSLVKNNIVGSFLDRQVAYLASDHQGSNFNFCVWRAVANYHHPQELLLAQLSLHVHKVGLEPHSFHFYSQYGRIHINRGE